MSAEPAPCDNCGKDIPGGDIGAGIAGTFRGALLCPACLPRSRAARARRIGLAAGGVALAAAFILRLASNGNGPQAPPGTPAAAVPRPLIQGEVPDDPADAIAALRTEISERLAALDRPAGSGPGDLAALADAVDAIRMKLSDFETRLARLESSGEIAPSGPGAGEPASIAPAPDPLADEIRKELADRDPRARLAGLLRLSELPSGRAAAFAPLLAPLLADEYGYVRREAARQAGALGLADLAGALLERLATEDDLLARDQICRSLAAITAIPYDPLAHTGEMLDRQIERWKTWTESR